MENLNNQSQPISDENHIKTLERAEAIKKLKDLANSAQNCFFVPVLKLEYPYQ